MRVFNILTMSTVRTRRGIWCLQHLDLIQMFGHGKGNLINCMAQTLIRIINAIVGPTKMHFGERCPIHQTQFAAKIFYDFWQIVIRVAPFMTGSSRPRGGSQVHTIIASFAKLLSRGLRPIFGGGVRNNCNAIFTSNGLWMIRVMSIVLARVCDLPRRGWVSMCMDQWWTHSHCIHTHHDMYTTTIGIKRVSHVWPYTTEYSTTAVSP